MTLEQKLKWFEDNLQDDYHILEALRKAIEQRDYFLRELRAYDDNDAIIKQISADADKQLLGILESK